MQYQSPMPPAYISPSHNQPQYAQFDAPSSKPINGDALPAMPSWETAQSRRVEVEEMPDHHTDIVELSSLNNNPRDEVRVPMLAQTEHADQSPLPSPYAYSPPHEQAPFTGNHYGAAQSSQNGYRGASSPPPPQQQRRPVHYGAGAQGYSAQQPYAAHSQGDGMSPGYMGSQHNDLVSTVSPTYANAGYTGYAPSGSTRFEDSYAPHQQERSPPFQEQRQQVGRKPVNGTWRDI